MFHVFFFLQLLGIIRSTTTFLREARGIGLSIKELQWSEFIYISNQTGAQQGDLWDLLEASLLSPAEAGNHNML